MKIARRPSKKTINRVKTTTAATMYQYIFSDLTEVKQQATLLFHGEQMLSDSDDTGTQ